MIVFEKQPLEILDYDIHLEDWFGESSEDDIESVSFVVSGDDESLEVGPEGYLTYVLLGEQPQSFKMWVGGGTDRKRYRVTATVNTEHGRVKEVEMLFKVKEV